MPVVVLVDEAARIAVGLLNAQPTRQADRSFSSSSSTRYRRQVQRHGRRVHQRIMILGVLVVVSRAG